MIWVREVKTRKQSTSIEPCRNLTCVPPSEDGIGKASAWAGLLGPMSTPKTVKNDPRATAPPGSDGGVPLPEGTTPFEGTLGMPVAPAGIWLTVKVRPAVLPVAVMVMVPLRCNEVPFPPTE